MHIYIYIYTYIPSRGHLGATAEVPFRVRGRILSNVNLLKRLNHNINNNIKFNTINMASIHVNQSISHNQYVSGQVRQPRTVYEPASAAPITITITITITIFITSFITMTITMTITIAITILRRRPRRARRAGCRSSCPGRVRLRCNKLNIHIHNQ